MPTIGNVNITFDKDMTTVTLSTEGTTISIPTDTFTEISKEVDKNCYYRKDVTDCIDRLIERGELPSEAAQNEAFINDVLDSYADLREDNDGDECGLTWTACLIEAFEDVDYNDYVEEE